MNQNPETPSAVPDIKEEEGVRQVNLPLAREGWLSEHPTNGVLVEVVTREDYNYLYWRAFEQISTLRALLEKKEAVAESVAEPSSVDSKYVYFQGEATKQFEPKRATDEYYDTLANQWLPCRDFTRGLTFFPEVKYRRKTEKPASVIRGSKSGAVSGLRDVQGPMELEMRAMNDRWVRLHEALGTQPDDDWDNAPFVYVEKLKQKHDVARLVNRFLAWPLPESVCSDPCVTQRGYPHRTGTNLLTANEAEQMIEHLLLSENAPKSSNASE